MDTTGLCKHASVQLQPHKLQNPPRTRGRTRSANLSTGASPWSCDSLVQRCVCRATPSWGQAKVHPGEAMPMHPSSPSACRSQLRHVLASSAGSSSSHLRACPPLFLNSLNSFYYSRFCERHTECQVSNAESTQPSAPGAWQSSCKSGPEIPNAF